MCGDPVYFFSPLRMFVNGALDVATDACAVQAVVTSEPSQRQRRTWIVIFFICCPLFLIVFHHRGTSLPEEEARASHLLHPAAGGARIGVLENVLSNLPTPPALDPSR